MAGIGASGQETPERAEGKSFSAFAKYIVAYLTRNRIVAGVGIRATPTFGGVVLSASPGSSANTAHPFKISVSIEDDGGGGLKPVCSVRYGTVQGKRDGSYAGVPTLNGGSTLDTAPQPTVDLSENGTWLLYFVMTFDGSERLTACDIDFVDPGSAEPTETAGTTHVYLLGSVVVTGEGTSSCEATPHNGVETSLDVVLCNGDMVTVGRA